MPGTLLVVAGIGAFIKAKDGTKPCAISAKAPLVASTSRCPASVSCTLRVVRRTSGTPAACSSSAMRRLIAALLTRRCLDPTDCRAECPFRNLGPDGRQLGSRWWTFRRTAKLDVNGAEHGHCGGAMRLHRR